MPISLEDVLLEMQQEVGRLHIAVTLPEIQGDALSHIANLQSYLKVLKRKLQAQQKKEAQRGD